MLNASQKKLKTRKKTLLEELLLLTLRTMSRSTLGRPFSSLMRSLVHPFLRRSYTAATIRARTCLETNVEREAIFFADEALGGDLVSPWHDIPLYAGIENRWNMVVEIPRGARAKMEVKTAAPLNPILQDVRSDGSLRFYGLDSIVNYGALPQTWEDPSHKDALTGLGGDGDPVDVCEIGSTLASVGDIYPVKIIGALGLIDNGETDWKVSFLQDVSVLGGRELILS